MRKEAKTQKSAVLSQVHGYHARSHAGNYAYLGFNSNKYFTSDRFIPLDADFRRPDGKPLKGYGLEIETECRGLSNPTVYAEVLNNIIFTHFPADLFKLQRDGSLGGDTSAECITQVMTKEFIRNNYANFKLMYDTYFPAFQVSCSRSGNCGMHCNISNAVFGRSREAQETAIRKLLYLVNRHFAFFCSLVARDAGRTEYCERMTRYASMNACKTVNLSDFASSHGVCFNLGHYGEGRIELRVVGGQSTFGCFRNTMESLFHVVEAVKTLSWTDLDDLRKIFTGCNQYVYNRLSTLCRQAGAIDDAALCAIRPTVKQEELL